MKLTRMWVVLLAAFPMLFLAVFFYLPLLSMLQEGVIDPAGHLTFRYLAATIQDPLNRRVILFTLEQAALSTLVTFLCGLPGAYLVAKFNFPGKSLLKALTTVPFVLPSIIASLGFILVFGNNGLFNRLLMSAFHLDAPPLRILYSFKAIILAHAFYNFPIVVRLVSTVWSQIDPKLEDAARALGASEFTVFRQITFPLLLPGIMASLALTFLFSLLSFAVVLVLGGVKYATIEVNIYMLMTVLLDYKMGSALALLQSCFSLSFMIWYAKTLAPDVPPQQATASAEPLPPLFAARRDVISWHGLGVGLYLLFVLLVILSPLAAVFGFSVTQRQHGVTSWSLQAYYKIFTLPYSPILGTTPLQSIRNSIFFGGMTVLCALPLGVSIALLLTRTKFPGKNVFDALVMLPLGISAVSLGLGYARSFNQPPLLITGTWYVIVFAHTVLAYPFVMRAVTPILASLQTSLGEAAQSLGANRWQIFWLIELPILKPGLIVGATFAFALSLGEMGATYLLYRPEWTTMPISIYRFLSAHDLVGASAMGMILIAVCTVLFIGIEKTGYKTL